MSEAIHDSAMSRVPILYEISLAIGRSLDLERNCEIFLETLLRAKNFAYGGVWLRKSSLYKGQSPANGDDAYVLVYGSPPFRIRELVIPADHIIVKRLQEAPFYSVGCDAADFGRFITESRISRGAYAVYDLGGIGFLKLYRSARSDAFPYAELNQLRSVVSKFAVSVKGCLAHRALELVARERQRALDSLRKSERKYRAVVESARDGIIVTENQRILFANGQAARMLGLTAEQLVGMRVTDFLLPQHVGAFREFCRRRLKGIPGTDMIELEMVTAGPEKRTLDVWLTVNPADYDGRAAALLIARDVTERRRVEAERARLALALEQATDAVIITNTDARISYVNMAFEKFWERRQSDVLGQPLTVLGAEDPEIVFDMQKTAMMGRPWRGRLRHRRRDGRTVICDTTGNPMRDEKGDLVAYVFVQRDITRELELQEEYFQAQKMESVGRLAGGIAHDFNNIMTAILGFGAMILEKMESDNELRHAVEQIVTAAERATNLTRQLLAFSRRGVAQVRRLDLNSALREMEGLLRRTLGEDIELALRLDPGDCCVMADPGMIQQIVMNLAVNARDAMPRGGRLVISTRAVSLDDEFCRTRVKLRPGNYVHFTCSDAGCGMSPDVLARAFDPFFTTKPPGTGSGLGLSTVYGIVDRCGGHVEIESEIARGTTVHIWLPMVEAVGEAAAPTAEEETRGGSEIVLVVEDESMVRDLAVRVLSSAGYAVLSAADGREALELVEKLEGRVDLVLSDVVMPVMGGLEMAESLQEKYPHIKVLYMTGFSDRDLTERGRRVPGERILLKPFTRDALTRRVREILETAKKARTHTEAEPS